MVAKKDTEALGKELPKLDLDQGYLVRKDADGSLQPLETRRSDCRSGMTYTTMRLAVKPIDQNCNGKTAASDSGSSPDKSSGKKPGEKPPEKKEP